MRIVWAAALQLAERGHLSRALARMRPQVDALARAVAHLHPRCPQRIEQQPALGIGETAGRQRLVDLLEDEEAAADPPGEERLSRPVGSPDLQRRHPLLLT